MIYAAATFWLLVAMLIAWGVLAVWSRAGKPQTIERILLPGTIAMETGRIVGLLITGAKTCNVPQPEEGGKPAAPRVDWQSRLPVVGPVIVALLPMALLSGLIYLLCASLGASVVAGVPADQISPVLPDSAAAFWAQLRGLISLAEGTGNALASLEGWSWQSVLFAYLMICMTVRLAPHPANVRGHFFAAIVLGLAGALAGTVSTSMPELITRAWPIMAVTIGCLLLVLFLSLALRGMAAAFRVFLREE